MKRLTLSLGLGAEVGSRHCSELFARGKILPDEHGDDRPEGHPVSGTALQMAVHEGLYARWVEQAAFLQTSGRQLIAQKVLERPAQPMPDRQAPS